MINGINYMKKIGLIIVVVFWVNGMFAQTLSVGQYRARVLDYNQDIRKSQQAAEGALYSLKSIKIGRAHV